MRSITYVSTSSKILTEADRKHLLDVSRENNLRDDITGLLLFEYGSFMQTFEGPKGPVAELFKRIQKDQRHHGMIVLLDHEILERAFPHWKMAYRNVGDDGNHVHYTEDDGDEIFWATHSPAKQLLSAFRNRMR